MGVGEFGLVVGGFAGGGGRSSDFLRPILQRPGDCILRSWAGSLPGPGSELVGASGRRIDRDFLQGPSGWVRVPGGDGLGEFRKPAMHRKQGCSERDPCRGGDGGGKMPPWNLRSAASPNAWP